MIGWQYSSFQLGQQSRLQPKASPDMRRRPSLPGRTGSASPLCGLHGGAAVCLALLLLVPVSLSCPCSDPARARWSKPSSRSGRLPPFVLSTQESIQTTPDLFNFTLKLTTTTHSPCSAAAGCPSQRSGTRHSSQTDGYWRNNASPRRTSAGTPRRRPGRPRAEEPSGERSWRWPTGRTPPA